MFTPVASSFVSSFVVLFVFSEGFVASISSSCSPLFDPFSSAAFADGLKSSGQPPKASSWQFSQPFHRSSGDRFVAQDAAAVLPQLASMHFSIVSEGSARTKSHTSKVSSLDVDTGSLGAITVSSSAFFLLLALFAIFRLLEGQTYEEWSANIALIKLWAGDKISYRGLTFKKFLARLLGSSPRSMAWVLCVRGDEVCGSRKESRGLSST